MVLNCKSRLPTDRSLSFPTLKVVAERIARAHHPGKLVLVGSVVSYFGLVRMRFATQSLE